MHRLTILIAFLLLPGAIAPAQAAADRLSKVLPTYLDLEGRHALSPSLFDRDAYQAHLRQHPEERSGLRFDIRWKARAAAPLKLRVELRGGHGDAAMTAKIETTVQAHGSSRWSVLRLTGEEYKRLGDLMAWRATLWDGDRQLAEQKSFLW